MRKSCWAATSQKMLPRQCGQKQFHKEQKTPVILVTWRLLLTRFGAKSPSGLRHPPAHAGAGCYGQGSKTRHGRVGVLALYMQNLRRAACCCCVEWTSSTRLASEGPCRAGSSLIFMAKALYDVLNQRYVRRRTEVGPCMRPCCSVSRSCFGSPLTGLINAC